MPLKRDKQDWKDDLLVFGQLFVVFLLGSMFWTYLQEHPTIAELLMPRDVAIFVIAFGPFLLFFLFLRWLNREKV